jgi:hypothetical protein
MGIDVPELDDSHRAAARKPLAALKASLFSQYAARRCAILRDTASPESGAFSCSVCSLPAGDAYLGYPVLKFNSVLHSIVRQHRGSECAISCAPALRLCLHAVHERCTRAHSFNCPCDRGWRNCILPQWTDGFAEPPVVIQTAMRSFCAIAFGTFDIGIDALASEISLMEMRLRSFPHALDDIRFVTLIRHVYFAIAHSFDTAAPDGKGAFRRVLRRSLANRLADIKPTVAGLVAGIETAIRQFYFLRRCAILEYCLACDFAGSHDWDALLGWEALCSHFEIHVEGAPGALRPYTFCGLPATFLDFFKPPRSLSRNLDGQVLFSLTTGDFISTAASQQPRVIDMNDLRLKFHETYCPVILVVGNHANTALYLSFEWNKQFANASSPIYVDRFGDPDIGFRRGEVLKLSGDAVEREVDRLLSHAWTDAVV